MPASPPSKLFIIYAREDQPALLELKAHLRPLEKRGDLTVWYDGEILPGQDWDKAIKTQLATADIVLLFISKYFFNSEYIEREDLKKALERHGKGETIVVPVIVKPCLWDAHPEISALQVLPKDGKAVSGWTDADEAFSDVARGVQKLMGATKKQANEAEEAKIAAQKVEEAIKAYDTGQIETAFQILSQYADTRHQVNPRGYHILGRIYGIGEGGVIVNYEEAMKWYMKGAEGEYLNSFVNMGLMYEKGQGVTQDYNEAVKWYRKAAEQGNADGENGLGVMYEQGYGVTKDLPTAVQWYRKAAAQGNESAKSNLKRLGYSE
ncbi:MAG: toll/interleukin-1 receptor domain-containing protein [Saprospiraceae bacterium]|nr:toll/interleukin-1 receptor domain-containing protein [Saprospiraceae bacterium]